MSEYVPRLTAPAADDPRWIMSSHGGYNDCIAGSNGPPSVLPNCTGYVHGRCMEIAGINTDNMGLSFGNAVTYYSQSSSDWIQSSEPSLGAVMVFCQNEVWEPGHVAIVEQIIDNNTIVISQSDYGGARFSTWTCTRYTNWTPFTNVSFIGFLKNPYVSPEPPEPSGSKAKYAILMLAGIRKRREENGRIKRYSDLI